MPISAPEDASWFIDREHIFVRQRLEVETVAGVVVGRDRFRIAIHHDRLVAVFAKSKGGVAAAVVELDSLPDTIRAAARNNDLVAMWVAASSSSS